MPNTFTLWTESVEEILGWPVLITKFENRSEQRRLVVSKQVIGFRIKSPWLNKTQMQEYRDFYIGQKGMLIGFYYTSPFDDTQYTVRFEEGGLRTVYAKGVLRCEFNFQRINADEA